MIKETVIFDITRPRQRFWVACIRQVSSVATLLTTTVKTVCSPLHRKADSMLAVAEKYQKTCNFSIMDVPLLAVNALISLISKPSCKQTHGSVLENVIQAMSCSVANPRLSQRTKNIARCEHSVCLLHMKGYMHYICTEYAVIHRPFTNL
jgi:hypothetical protein